jgi:glucose-6-phosphate isomerase
VTTTARRQLVERIWERDPTIWTGKDEGRWLGWLDEPFRMREDVGLLLAVAGDVSGAVDDVVLLGMGGSSLAPEVLRMAFGSDRLHVLDTTHPAVIRELAERLDLERTLFVTSSKSGTTLETRSHADFFWNRAPRGSQWVAVTDPGSELEGVARNRGFRAVFAGEPTIGGRYSALSSFGMLPAALLGVDVAAMLDLACEMAEACRSDEDNPGLELGLELGQGWESGRDKICLTSELGFGLWAEQLLAESTGKAGKGLVPAPGESPDGPDRQSPAVELPGPYELGREFFRWEFATAVAGSLLGVNPFDQPDVQGAKDRTNAVLASGDVELDARGSVDALLAQGAPPDYVAILAFVSPTAAAEAKLAALAARARQATGCVVTTGLGPRFLHSTGQLHKGGPNTGLFIQVVEDYGAELEIPGRPFGFARLIRAQAAADFDALRAAGRRVARVRMEEL